ncbi:MAG TPA: NAD(P)/FAD-dependent oxidoreductase [Pyrinomonadaceae bacterium]|nr:NAD(P)/FAD-dependent oxidoreductase [Pyrinomonadaceae bacterium]
MDSFDVTIVGAGLAGLQCARLLGQSGRRVLLLDRKNSLTRNIHTTGIFVRRTLTDFDIPEDCLGPAIRDVTLYSPRHRPLELKSKHDEFRIGRMGRLYTFLLNRCLLAGVSWLPESSYESCSELGPRTCVNIKAGSQPRSILTRYLVGGDGASSRVGHDLQLDTNKEWIVGVENVYEQLHFPGPPRLLCFVDSALAPGYIGWVAHDGDETHVGVAGYPAKFEPLPALTRFTESVKDIVDLTEATLIERRGGRIPIGGVLRKIANSRGLLIGDAAGAVSPLTAGGLDPCMRLSTFAAQVINEFLESGDAEVLDQYSGDYFRTRFASRLWARRLAAAVNNNTLMELGCAALRLPVVKKLAAHVFFGRGSFPDAPRLPKRAESAVHSVAGT